jgi:hypothetical protein
LVKERRRLPAPEIPGKPMTVNEMLRMPGVAAAQLLYDRSPSKAWALRRALDELLDGDAAPKPKSGWSINRERATRTTAGLLLGRWCYQEALGARPR